MSEITSLFIPRRGEIRVSPLQVEERLNIELGNKLMLSLATEAEVRRDINVLSWMLLNSSGAKDYTNGSDVYVISNHKGPASLRSIDLRGYFVKVEEDYNCQRCNRSATVDGVTKFGAWGYFCSFCYAVIGTSKLGIGYGQILLKDKIWRQING